MRVLLLGLGLLCACPGNSEHKPSPALPPCARFGQTCEYSPGKLGSCVERDNCTQGNCFVCQSQH